MTDKAMSLKELEDNVFAMANAQLKSKEHGHLYAVPLNRKNAGFYILQRAHFVLNRRCCWAAVQCTAPFDVKGLIWEHEQEELVGDPARGPADHYTLGVQEGESVGLSPAEFEIGEKMRDELGIGFERQQSNAEHMVAEIEHANLLFKAAESHGRSAEAQAQILRGAEASLAIDRVY